MCEYIHLSLEQKENEQRHQRLLKRLEKYMLDAEIRNTLEELEEQRQNHNKLIIDKMQQIESKAEQLEEIPKQIYILKNINGWPVHKIATQLNYSEKSIHRIYKKAIG